MLKLLGVIFYAVSALSILLAILRMAEPGFLAYAVPSAIASAFSGAMCFAANDIRALLTRLADRFAPLPDSDQPGSDHGPPAGETPEPAELTPEEADEERLMAAYDIRRDGEFYLTYGRYRHPTLAAAVAYMKKAGADEN